MQTEPVPTTGYLFSTELSTWLNAGFSLENHASKPKSRCLITVLVCNMQSDSGGPSQEPPSPRGAQVAPCGTYSTRTVRILFRSLVLPHGREGKASTCASALHKYGEPLHPAEGEGMNVSGPTLVPPIFPKTTAQKSSLASKSLPSSPPLSTYMFAKAGVTEEENKSGAISEYSIPDCVKSSFCDFLMWFTIQWQPLMSIGVIIYFILIQSFPAEPSRVLTAIFNGVFLLLGLDTVITVALLLFVEGEINKFFLKHFAPELNTNQPKLGSYACWIQLGTFAPTFQDTAVFRSTAHQHIRLCSTSHRLSSLGGKVTGTEWDNIWVFLCFLTVSSFITIVTIHNHFPVSGHLDSSYLEEEIKALPLIWIILLLCHACSDSSLPLRAHCPFLLFKKSLR